MAGPTDPIDNSQDDGAATVADDAVLSQGDGNPLEAMLAPDSELHRKLLGKIMSRVNASARYRGNRYPDWDRVDERMRLFTSLNRKAILADKTTDPKKVEMPFQRAIIMPVSLAIAEVRRAQKLSLYLSRSPILQIDGRSPDDISSAKKIEAMIAYDTDNMGFANILSGMFGDADKYGEGTVYDVWEIERGTKRLPPIINSLPPMIQSLAQRFQGVSALSSIFQPQVLRNVPVMEGNRCRNVDPYMFFPDPRIPLSRMQEMEYVDFLQIMTRMQLISKSTKNGGPYFNLDALAKGGSMEARAYTRSRVRDQVQGSEGFAIRDNSSRDSGVYAVDHMQVKIIPSEWGLGSETEPTIWWFSVANETTIIRAHESPYEHGRFTFSTIESQMDPHPTMNPGTVELLDGLQRVGDWLINSRIANVRQMMNNIYAYCRTMVEEGDVENAGPGKHIRASDIGEKALKDGTISWDTIIHQMQVMDFTGAHGQLFEMIFQQAQRMSAANDPAMGEQTSGDTTLGEVQSMLAASSQRIAMETRLQDTAGIAPLVRRMIANRQQFTSMEQFYRIMGSDAKPGDDRMVLGADDVQGDFDYIPNTGTNPADPARFAQTWQQLFQTVISSGLAQQARPDGSTLDVFSIFDEMVRSMGIRDVETFYKAAPPPQPQMPVQVMPDDQVQQQVQAGNIVPASQAPPMPQ